MAVKQDVLRGCLEDAFPDSQIHIDDTMGDQDHYAVTITSAAFIGRPLVQRHKMVYDALGEMMEKRLHALSLKTLTPTIED